MEDVNTLESSVNPNFVESSFHCEDCTCEIIDTLVTFQFLKMDRSLYIWIGPSSCPVLNDLSMAFPTSYDNVPAGTHLLGSSESINMARRISKKLSIPVFISYNLVAEDRMILPAVEKKLMEELNKRTNLIS